jgi:hypothetical protein
MSKWHFLTITISEIRDYSFDFFCDLSDLCVFVFNN